MKLASTKQQGPAQQNVTGSNHKNEKIKTGGNQRSNEDDLDLDKQPYSNEAFLKLPTNDQPKELNNDK